MNDIDIVNAALANLGAPKIAAISDNDIMAAQYPITRDDLLSARQWTFAKSRAALALAPDVPPFGYTYKYILPSDILTVIRIWRADGRTPVTDFVRELGFILTNQEAPVFAELMVRVPESAFHPAFTKALVRQLTADTALAVTENRALADSWELKAEAALLNATVLDGKQGINETVTLPPMPGRRSHFTGNRGRF